MNCHRCGFANDVGSRFCNKCGASIFVPSAEKNPKSETWKWVLGILVGMCVLTGILRNLGGNSSSTQSVSGKYTERVRPCFSAVSPFVI